MDNNINKVANTILATLFNEYNILRKTYSLIYYRENSICHCKTIFTI